MTDSDLNRRLTTIVAVDVAGYSRLVRADDEGTLRALRGHRQELFDPLIEHYGGRIANTAGDSMLLEFPSAVEAVRCAIAVQAGLAKRNQDIAGDKQIKLRIGINIGDVISEGEDLLGDGVNVAARLEALADPGGICLSRATREQVRDQLDLNLQDLGEVEVKNIARPVRVFKILAEGEAASQPFSASHRPIWQSAAIAIGLLAVLAIGGGAWWWLQQPDFEPADPKKFAYKLPEKPSIAVLPFDNLTGDKNKNYVGDGLAENIIAVLAETPHLFVIARNSSFTYKGKATKVQEIAEQLGVRYVLEGSVQSSGDKMRVTAQLVDALSGKHLWAGRFDRRLSDLFAVQDEITDKIARAMDVKLVHGDMARTWLTVGKDPKYYRMLVEGRQYYQRFTPEGYRAAEQRWRQLYQKYPDYAVLMGWLHWQKIRIGISMNIRADFSKAREYAKLALAVKKPVLNSYLLSATLDVTARKFASAIRNADMALKFSNGSGQVGVIGWVKLNAGQASEAVVLIKKNMREEPFHAQFHPQNLNLALMVLGRLDEAKNIGEGLISSRKLQPGIRMVILHRLAAIAVWQNELDLAKSYVSKIKQLDANASLADGSGEYRFFKDRAFVDRYFSALRKAGLPEHPPGKGPKAKPKKPSIAVLPFTNMSGDKEQEYFADGMTEDLITDLSKISGLFVIARNSSFAYRGKTVDIKKIGRELNVKYVLEGSVRRAGNNIRINAQLIDAETGGHLWADRFDGVIEDVFKLQDQVTAKIVQAMKVKLTGKEKQSLETAAKVNPKAYELYRQGLNLHRAFKSSDLAKMLKLYGHAIKLNPDFAAAHARLAHVAFQVGRVNQFWILPQKQALNMTDTHARKALALEPDNALALTVLAHQALETGQADKAIKMAERAVAAAPSDADAVARQAYILSRAGRYDDAIATADLVLRLEPNPSAAQLMQLSNVYFHARQYDKAVKHGETARAMGIRPIWALETLVAAYARLKMQKKLARAMTDLDRLWPNVSRRFYRHKFHYFRPQATLDHWLESLRQAGVPQWPKGILPTPETMLTKADVMQLFIAGAQRIGSNSNRWRFRSITDGKGAVRSIWRNPKGRQFRFSSTESRLILTKDGSQVRERCAIDRNKVMDREDCALILRNPGGNKASRDEYLLVSVRALAKFSVFPASEKIDWTKAPQ